MSEPTSKHKEESALQQDLDSPAAAKGLDDSYQPVPDVRDDPVYFARLYDQTVNSFLQQFLCYRLTQSMCFYKEFHKKGIGQLNSNMPR